MKPGRVAVIGDLAGHLDELRAELRRLGADPATDELPGDLIVVQVGDLIHRGPDSAGVVALVDQYLREQPAHWVQLAGNHEAQYLRIPAFDWPEQLDDSAAATLRRWWDSGVMKIAAAVRAGGEEWLISHAGLTEGFWREALDAPATAAEAARAVNSFIGTHEAVLFHAGEMLGGGRPDFTAGPVWAAAGTELLPSWLRTGRPMPFSQVHGHSMAFQQRERDRRWRRPRGSRAVDAVLTVDQEAAQETAVISGGRIVGVDPGHGREAHHPWRALVLTDAVVLDGSGPARTA